MGTDKHLKTSDWKTNWQTTR